jgi:hypothetical protein
MPQEFLIEITIYLINKFNLGIKIFDIKTEFLLARLIECNIRQKRKINHGLNQVNI